jgi:hypothetical protein
VVINIFFDKLWASKCSLSKKNYKYSLELLEDIKLVGNYSIKSLIRKLSFEEVFISLLILSQAPSIG